MTWFIEEAHPQAHHNPDDGRTGCLTDEKVPKGHRRRRPPGVVQLVVWRESLDLLGRSRSGGAEVDGAFAIRP